MRVIRIDENSSHLNAVKNLWRRNSKTLGFFPEGAFKDHAASRCILIAESSTHDLLGYLLYRIVRRHTAWPQATIVHLCTQEGHRNTGVAKALLEKLCELTKDRFVRIDLRCRRDYDASNLWRKHGFVYHGEEVGKAGYPVNRWILTIRQPPLMALLDQAQSENKLRAVIDANVLYRLQDPFPLLPAHNRLLSEEAKALLEEWLFEDVLLLVTDESLNEIEKNNSAEERASRLKYAQNYQRASCHLQEVQAVITKLQCFFQNNPAPNTEADIRQVAHAIAANVDCFITQDMAILRKAEDINSEFKIKVMSPGQFIGHVDEVIRETKYRPEHLAGAYSLTRARLKSTDFSSLYTVFRSTDTSEKRSSFENTLRSYMSQPEKFDIQLCKNIEHRPISLFVYDRSEKSELTIPLLRVARSPLSSTIYRYLLYQAVTTSIKEKRSIIRVYNLHVNIDMEEALQEIGFINIDNDWVKISLSYLGESPNLISTLTRMKLKSPHVAELIDNLTSAISSALSLHDNFALAEVERKLWPAKILDSGIQNYVIPIKPVWAQHLFDPKMAEQTLWGAKEDLALRTENVYYRSKRFSGIAIPSRVLWYVTGSMGYLGSKHIRASSILDEVVIGRANDLYRRFRRLGIYQWSDVLRTANNNPDNHIMALKFSNTELFPKPVSLEAMREIFNQTEGYYPVLRSPQSISVRCFAHIYSAANELHGGGY